MCSGLRNCSGAEASIILRDFGEGLVMPALVSRLGEDY